MAARLLFVHGTGVREVGFTSTLEVIKRKDHGIAASVHGCFWGQAEGARLRGGGASIPGYADAGGAAPTEADELLAVWSMLYTDPWYELRLLRHMPRAAAPVFGQEPSAAVLRRGIDEFVPSGGLEEALTAAQLADRFDAALAALKVAPELDQAIATAPPDPLEHRRAIARALIAYAIVAAEEDGKPPPDGAARDECVTRLTDDLHGYGLGVGEFLTRPFKGVAVRMATSRLTRKRGAITDGAAPLAGDILRFLARGDGVLQFLKDAIADPHQGPTYLLAHSLGGIMCADLLIRERIADVAGLITVGSQAPFLYEIGALPSLMYPEPLPSHFPSWLNIYDRRDVLSYVCGGPFTGDVTDVEVDNRQPFPQSHSAYWTNSALWAAVAGVVR